MTASSRSWLITGVSSGFGLALARHALAQGERVAGTVLADTDIVAFEALAPGRALGFTLDVTDAAAISKTLPQVLERTDGVDVLVNNAGYGLVGSLEELSWEELRHQMETHFGGPFRLVRALAGQFRQRGGGRILNISSMAGFSGQPGMSAYCASKFAVAGLSEALARELAGFGVRVTAVYPGPFRTAWGTVGLRRVRAPLPAYDATRGVSDRAMAQGAGNEAGDPERAAALLYRIAGDEDPPVWLPLGEYAIGGLERRLRSLEAELQQWEARSRATVFPPEEAAT